MATRDALPCTECGQKSERSEMYQGICPDCLAGLRITWSRIDAHHDNGGHWGGGEY